MGGSTVVGVANRATLVPFHNATTRRITGLRLKVITASGNIDVGIANGTARLGSSGSTVCPAAGVRTLNLSAPLTLGPGDYFAVITSDNSTVELDGVTTGATVDNAATMVAAFPLPTTFTLGSAPTGIPSLAVI
jgi:hypothetical protein